jgi:hypothetical protein
MFRIAIVVLAATCYAQDTAVITDSGSTNTAGYTIVVERSGKAAYTPIPRRFAEPSDAPKPAPKNLVIPKKLVRRFFVDLHAAKPLADLPRHGCMKSASFGSTLNIKIGDDTSPDLSCPSEGNAKVQSLIDDTRAIVKLFE